MKLNRATSTHTHTHPFVFVRRSRRLTPKRQNTATAAAADLNILLKIGDNKTILFYFIRNDQEQNNTPDVQMIAAPNDV